MTSRRHIAKVLVLGAPLLAGLISEFFMYLADSAMVGRLGTEYLAAIGIAVVCGEILWCVVWPLAPATQAIASRRYGRQTVVEETGSGDIRTHERKTGAVLNHSIILALAAGIAAIVLAGFCKNFLVLILDDELLISRVDAYIRVLAWVMPMAGVFYALYGFLAAINLTRPIMAATIALNILNIAFNYVLIYGKLGFPAMGMEGAALGTVLSQSLGTVYLLAYVLGSKKIKRYRCFRFRRIRLPLLKEVVNNATPVGVDLVIVLSIYLLYESFIANMGSLYLAVTHIIFTVFILKRTIVGGFAEGGSILIGNKLGQKNRREAVRYALASEWIALAIGFCLFLSILLFPESIARIFNQEAETVDLAAKALRFFAVFFLIDITGYPFEVIFTHNGWGKFVLYASSATNLTFMIGLTLVLTRVFDMGIYAAWTAFSIQIVVYTGVLMAGFLSKRWLNAVVE